MRGRCRARVEAVGPQAVTGAGACRPRESRAHAVAVGVAGTTAVMAEERGLVGLDLRVAVPAGCVVRAVAGTRTGTRAGVGYEPLAWSNHRLALATLGRGNVGIGMERGWDAYQWLAWNAAYGSARTAMPLLYARSSTEPAHHVSLRSFNLRQFW